MLSRMRSRTGWTLSKGSWMVRWAEESSVMIYFNSVPVYIVLLFSLSSVLESWMDYTGELEPPEPLSRLPQLKHRMKRLLTQLGKVQQISLYSSTWGRQRTTAALVHSAFGPSETTTLKVTVGLSSSCWSCCCCSLLRMEFNAAVSQCHMNIWTFI